MTEQIAYDHTWVHQDVLGGRMANISIFEVYHYRDSVAINSQTHGFSFIQLNPRSVASNKSILSDDGLRLSRFGLPTCFLYGLSRNLELMLHHSKLAGDMFVRAAQGEPLKNGGSESQETNDNQKPSRPDQSSRCRYEWGFMGALVICVGAELLRLSMELFYKADKASRLSAAAIIFAVGGAAIVHGLVYACLGMNGLRELYFL